MKYMFVILFGVFLVSGQTQEINQAVESLVSGQSTKLVQYMNPSIHFSINGQSEWLPKNTAAFRLQSFLSTIRPTEVIIQHEGKSKDNFSSYKVARIISEPQNYRLFVLVESSGSSMGISELKLDKE